MRNSFAITIVLRNIVLTAQKFLNKFSQMELLLIVAIFKVNANYDLLRAIKTTAYVGTSTQPYLF